MAQIMIILILDNYRIRIFLISRRNLIVGNRNLGRCRIRGIWMRFRWLLRSIRIGVLGFKGRIRGLCRIRIRGIIGCRNCCQLLRKIVWIIFIRIFSGKVKLMRRNLTNLLTIKTSKTTSRNLKLKNVNYKLEQAQEMLQILLAQ